MVDLLLAALLLSGAEGCGHREVGAGQCRVEGTIGGGGAVLDGTIRGPGADAGGSGDTTETIGGETLAPEIPTGFYCGRRTSERCEFPTPTTPDTALVTLTDIAHFAADPGTLSTEPSGWAVIGLPLNAISSATPHRVSGTLLGQPATVRFTPVGWTFDYGDGTTQNTITGGATWSTLGLDEFSTTATSHRYRDRGTHHIHVDVHLVADYRLGPDESGDPASGAPDPAAWHPIPGMLTLRVDAPSTTRAVTVRTVLVAHTCTQRPAGPGC